MLRSFSHIYIEDSILTHPRTQSILSKFKNANVIPIKHYKDVFNRKNQNFTLQKSKPNLILAKKTDHFLYPGSGFSPNFSHEHFYYNTLALNCIYDCEYCYLQGMFSSANLVLFVNWEDFFQATDAFLEKNKSLYLALSYDTDLLAIESFFPATAAWLEFAESRENLTIEIRTKSANFRGIQNQSPIPNAILAWTLSPERIAKEIEHKTPGLSARLDSIREASERGWKVRLCLDPILRTKIWKEDYKDLAEKIKSHLNPTNITELSIGGFRMNLDFLKEMQQKRKDSAVLFYPYERSNQIATYPSLETKEMLDYVTNLFLDWVPKEKIQVSFG